MTSPAFASGRTPVARVIVRDLTRRFGGTMALRGVSAEFEAGEIVSIEGPNGSGKSTLLGIIGTVLAPSSGEVLFQPGGRSRESLREEIGWVSHDTLAYPDLSARQNIRFAASLHGVDPDTAWEAAAKRFNFGAFSNRPVRTYSRGQRQRTALARALVQSPSLLLLDEPTAGLDAEGIQRLLDVIRQESARGAIVLVVTHDVDLIGTVATRRLRLERGKVAASDALPRRECFT